MPVVDAAAVLANLTQQKFVVLDARAQNRYRGETEPMDPVAGHIPGALNRPNSLNCQPDGTFKSAAQLRDEFQAVLKRTPADRVVHQCGSGITACHNLFAMELAGLTGSALYPGSWSEWCSDPDRPVATGDEPAV
jgi:thiosulfate/3-mercaptopyruvate sulfurtransferase